MGAANGTTALAQALGVSRQRAWQILRMADGQCAICGKPSVTTERCEFHRQQRCRLEKARYDKKRATR